MNYRGKNIETQASGFEDLLRSGDFVLSSAASFGTSGTSGTSPSWRFPKLLWQNEPRNKLEDDPEIPGLFLHFPTFSLGTGTCSSLRGSAGDPGGTGGRGSSLTQGRGGDLSSKSSSCSCTAEAAEAPTNSGL